LHSRAATYPSVNQPVNAKPKKDGYDYAIKGLEIVRDVAFVIDPLLWPVLLVSCGGGGGGGGGGNGGGGVPVPPVNHPPVINSAPITTANAGVLYLYDVDAADADNNTLSYSLTSAPSGMTIDPPSGLIEWRPTASQMGTFDVEVEVTDGTDSVYQGFSVVTSLAFQRGSNFTSYWNNDYLQPRSNEALGWLTATNTQWVSILVTQYQDTTSSTTIYSDVDKTPTDAAIVNAINVAHFLGFNVMLNTHVDVKDESWRGFISFSNEADWQAWFASYDQFIGHYADLSRENGVEALVVGVEYSATEQREANWRNTITQVRSIFPNPITYSANHDSYQNINWWDALDFIGVSAYFQLTTKYDPTSAELLAAWAPYVNSLGNLAAAKNKYIVFTEIGYQSYDGTNTIPWDAPTKVQDLAEQGDCYTAAFQSVYTQPWFKGVYFWMWYFDPTQDVNGYDIYGKPAENVVKTWYAQ